MAIAHFLKHTPCPDCGSKDNRALYSDGSSFCFGCRATNRANPWRRSQGDNVTGELDDIKRKNFTLPKDLVREIPRGPVEWASQVGISVVELLSREALWYPERKQLLFTFTDEAGNFILQQGRNFNPFYKQKYFTYGSPNEVIPIYYKEVQRQTRTLVVVEDCLSAIKIARQSDAMPVLSSDLSRDKLKRMARLYGAFLIWLDSNMYHKAQRIAQRLQLLGCEARAVYTDKDPKYYTDEEIYKLLQLQS